MRESSKFEEIAFNNEHVKTDFNGYVVPIAVAEEELAGNSEAEFVPASTTESGAESAVESGSRGSLGGIPGALSAALFSNPSLTDRLRAEIKSLVGTASSSAAAMKAYKLNPFASVGQEQKLAQHTIKQLLKNRLPRVLL